MSDKHVTMADAFRHLVPQSMAEGISAGFPRIGMRGKVFTLIYQKEIYRFVREDDGTPLPYMDVVIVGFNQHVSKLYYPPGTYTEDSNNSPTCASLKGDVPDPGVPEKQSPTCGTCRHNEWTNMPGGGRGKECQDHKRLAVLLLPNMNTKPPLAAPLLEPVYLKVPPASLRSLKMYSDSLLHRGVHFASLITRVSFDPDRQFQLNFNLLKPLSNAEAPLVLPLLEDPQTRAILGAMVEVREAEPALPPVQETRDTGLMAAFGKQGNGAPPPKRTRNTKQITVEKAEQPAPQVSQTRSSPPEQATAATTSPPWEESDSDIDVEVSKLLEKKASEMF